MKNELKKIIFILDRSRTMEKLESETIQIFNTMIEEEKKQSENVTVTTFLCNHKYELLHDETPISEISPISDWEYWTGGKIALLDCIGNIILNTKEEQSAKNNPNERILFVIFTDGIDNAGSEYDLSQIRNIIKEQQESGWEFQFPICKMDSFFSGETGKREYFFEGYYPIGDAPEYTLVVRDPSDKGTCEKAISDILGIEFERIKQKNREEYEAK
ncbi:MAG: hypothetical protein Q4D65_00375 [Peptostreptococcaceae bacterium]|nr:hypothetical protein [Peptostreptococcaceae bacterium]